MINDFLSFDIKHSDITFLCFICGASDFVQEEAAEVQKQLTRVSKQLSAAQRENKRLRESLHEAEQTLPELQQQLREYNQTKAKLVVREQERTQLGVFVPLTFV